MCQRGSKVRLCSLCVFLFALYLKSLRLKDSWCISVPFAFVLVTAYCERRTKVKPALPPYTLATPVKKKKEEKKAFIERRNISCALNLSVSVSTYAHWSVYKACDRKFV